MKLFEYKTEYSIVAFSTMRGKGCCNYGGFLKNLKNINSFYFSLFMLYKCYTFALNNITVI